MMREGKNVGGPLLFYGHNFAYRKSRMCPFINSIVEMAWFGVLTELKHAMMKYMDGKDVPKSQIWWNETEKRASLSNGRAVNALFAAMDEDNFKLITILPLLKQLGIFFHTTLEGTSNVKISRMQMITTKYEIIRRKDDETIV